MIEAISATDLLEKLACIDTTVPPRDKGRNKEHVERYCIYKLLSSLSKKNLLGFPLEIHKRERPDYVLDTNGIKIGIECTEVVPENKAKLDSIANLDTNFRCIPKYKITDRTKNKKELIKLAKRDFATAWKGAQIEENWTEAMTFSINKKQCMLKKGYQIYDQNWLLMYDNWPPATKDHKIAISLLKEQFNKEILDFHKVYILAQENILVLLREGDGVQAYIYAQNEI